MDLRQLEILKAVAETGSMARSSGNGSPFMEPIVDPVFRVND